MMTLDEIRTTKINGVIAREAHDQASRRLDDVLQANKNFEQKAMAAQIAVLSPQCVRRYR